MIAAVAVDYGGVLVDEVTPAAAGRVARALGVTVDQLTSAVYGPNRTLWDAVKVGRIPEGELWARAQRELELPPDRVAWIRAQFDDVSPRHGLIAYLKSLKGKLGLALVSNAIPSYAETWRRLGFEEIFDVMINSSEVKMAKPDLGVFRLAAEGFGVQPADCAFIDDKADNVQAAMSIGMHGVYYRDEEQVIETFEALQA